MDEQTRYMRLEDRCQQTTNNKNIMIPSRHLELEHKETGCGVFGRDLQHSGKSLLINVS